MAKRCWKFSKAEMVKKSGLKLEDVDAKYVDNMDNLLEKVNELGKRVPDELKGSRLCNSGLRSAAKQISIYKERAKNKQAPFLDGVFDEAKVPKSAHMLGMAIDIKDTDGKLDDWLMNTDEGKQAVIDLDLYIEHKNYTNGWCHIQTRKTRSRNRYFIPY